ncbi:baeRF3 domain-containing protein [Geodermatophilus sp. URMC 64]
MNEFLAEDLVRLKGEVGAPRLSLFLPLSPGTSRSSKVRIRAKNALLRADKAMRETSSARPDTAHVLGLVKEALDQARPMGGNHLGLAVFADSERVRRYVVPLRLPELAAVGDRYTIAPVLPALNGQGRFYVLTLSQDEIRLHQGSPLSLEPVEVEGLELSAWRTMPRLRTPEVHAFVADRGGQRSRAIFHAVDRESNQRKERALQHFRGTDRALREVLQPSGAPLILAGVQHLQALYRAVNTYPHLLEAGIDGTAEQTDLEQLYRLARAAAEPEIRRHRRAALERYHELRGTGRTVGTVTDVHRAAVEGRVETVLINERACSWPSASAEHTLLPLDSTASADEEIELAVVETLRQSGTALVIPEGEWPAAEDVVAVLRY